ncbi:MAG: hypothetical protein KKH94_12250 [Candidatus Omnitrophica bacterium]|nr:hypothetical protein [Candidatus Omnitrophota bacterium]
MRHGKSVLGIIIFVIVVAGFIVNVLEVQKEHNVQLSNNNIKLRNNLSNDGIKDESVIGIMQKYDQIWVKYEEAHRKEISKIKNKKERLEYVSKIIQKETAQGLGITVEKVVAACEEVTRKQKNDFFSKTPTPESK